MAVAARREFTRVLLDASLAVPIRTKVGLHFSACLWFTYLFRTKKGWSLPSSRS